VPAVSPTVRQRQLGMRLRAIRAQKSLSVEAVAAELECSPSKISRMETASRRPNPRDIRDLCKFYGLDEATSQELVDLAREAKEPGWWRQYADVGLDPYIGLEQDASAITSFAALYVPALLQTGDYAEAIIKGIAPRMDSAVLKDRVEVRLRRQQLLDRGSPPPYRVLIDEAVLHRPTGGAEVMVAQIDKILELTGEGKATAQIVPFAAGAIASQDSNFVLLEFGESGLSSVVFIESLINNQILEKPADVDRYREAIDHLRDSALTPRESRNRMIELRKAHGSASRLRFRGSPRKTPFERISMAMYPSAPANLDWRRPRACEGGACIMVARDKDSVVFGNTTDPGGPAYAYSTAEWQQFIIGVKRGDFDGIA
jgi:transcriptional regulator with XRE-family HTH domain